MDNENVSVPSVEVVPSMTATPPPPGASGFFATPMPSVTELFTESWAVFKKSFANLFILNLLYWVLVALLVGGLLFLLFLFGGLSILPAVMGGAQTGSSVNPALFIPFIGILMLLGVIAVIGFIILASILQTGTLLIVSNADEKVSFGGIIKKSVGFIIPLAFVGIITGLLNFGAFFVFIFPVLIFSLFFLFSSYEVVLNGKSGLGALRSSAFVMKKRFGDVFVRLLAALLIYFCVWLCQIAISFMAKYVSVMETPMTLLFYGVNAVVGWFMTAYMVTLYKQAKNGLEDGEMPLKWFGLVSVIGWVLFFIYMTVFFAIFASSLGSYNGTKSGPYPSDTWDYSEETNIPDWNQKDIVPTIKWDTNDWKNSY